jgi:hypothetical protein
MVVVLLLFQLKWRTFAVGISELIVFNRNKKKTAGDISVSIYILIKKQKKCAAN